MKIRGKVQYVSASIVAIALVGLAQCSPREPQSRRAAVATSDVAVAAQKTYVAPGDLDEYYVFNSGGHSGNVYVYGIPSMRHISTIPVFTPGPSYIQAEVSMILPAGGEGFSLSGPPRLETGFANTSILLDSSLTGGELHTRSEIRQRLGEIAPGEISEARRRAQRIQADMAELVGPTDVRWRWDLDGAERRAKALLAQNLPGGASDAHDMLVEAMNWFEKAEAIRPPQNDDALLRWNACARIINANRLEARVMESATVMLE